MDSNGLSKIDLKKIKTPVFIVGEKALEDNLKILGTVQKKSGCKILLALKAYATWKTFPLIKRYLPGVCSGSLNETRLGYEEFGKEVHTYAPAFDEREFPEILEKSDFVVFNSFEELEKFLPQIKKSKKKPMIGLRVNPEKTVAGAIFGHYDPAKQESGLGVTIENLKGKSLDGITGLHFHALCEQGTEELKLVLEAFSEKFGEYIKKMEWVNFGGGHHITKKGYAVEELCEIIAAFKKQFPNIKQVYLEPGEAVALNAGILAATVRNISSLNETTKIAVLDISAEAHLVDEIITRHEPSPYVPEIAGAKEKGKLEHDYIIRGGSCAAGDVIGEYSFQEPLKPGDKLAILNAAIYTMVKTSTFCGIGLPAIALLDKKNKIKILKRFGYADFKNRLS